MFVGIAGGIAFPILPIAGLRAGLSLPFIGLILAANRIARIFASPIVGMLSDRLGGRRLLLAGMGTQIAVMSLYLAGVAFAHPGSCFLLARLLHGPGSACVFVAAQVLALHAGGKAHGGRSAGLVRAAMTSGMPLGLVLGGLLSARFGDRVTFAAAIFAVVVATVAAFVLVPDLRAEARARVDLRSTLRTIADRRILALGALNFATFFSAQGTILTTMVLFVGARGLAWGGLGNQATASLAMGALVLVSAGASLVAGRLGDRHHAHASFALAGLAVLIAGLLVTTFASSPATLFGAVALVGGGMGAMNPCLLALIGLFVASELSGRAVGAIQLLGDVGGALGPIVGATLLAHSTGAPFLLSAVVVLCVLPIAARLVRAERMATAAHAAVAVTETALPQDDL